MQEPELTSHQMATVEVQLKDDEALPEQHLDEGESIERVIVPISELYHKLKGKSFALTCRATGAE
jgi:ADP-ribose pyrophosphatase